MLKTREQIIVFLQNWYGENWVKLFADESGYDYSAVWKFSVNITEKPSRRMQLEVDRVKNKRQKHG